MTPKRERLSREEIAQYAQEDAVSKYVMAPRMKRLAEDCLAYMGALEEIAKEKGMGYKTHDSCHYCGESLPRHQDLCPTTIARSVLPVENEVQP